MDFIGSRTRGSPEVIAFRSSDRRTLATFYAYPTTFTGEIESKPRIHPDDQMSKTPIYFPNCFFGPGPQTKAAWKEIFDKAWLHESWSNDFSNLDTRDIHQDHYLIILNDSKGQSVPPGNPESRHNMEEDFVSNGTDLSNLYWRLNWVASTYPPDYHFDRVTEGYLNKYRQFLCQNFDKAWFLIAMLEPSMPIRLFHHRDDMELARGFLRGVINWLPEICSLRSRYTYATGGEPYTATMAWEESFIWYYLESSLKLLGIPDAVVEFEEGTERAGFIDLFSTLIKSGLALQNGERFQPTF
jgi:hypothetical protein